MSFYLVMYDIPEEADAIRTRINAVLQDYGLEQVQCSVFMGWLLPKLVKKVQLHLDELTGSIDADIHMFPVCEKNITKLITVRSRKPVKPFEIAAKIGKLLKLEKLTHIITIILLVIVWSVSLYFALIGDIHSSNRSLLGASGVLLLMIIHKSIIRKLIQREKKKSLKLF